jgi:hypothetical protein
LRFTTGCRTPPWQKAERYPHESDDPVGRTSFGALTISPSGPQHERKRTIAPLKTLT